MKHIVSFHLKSGKTIKVICKEISVILNSNSSGYTLTDKEGYSLFTIDVDSIEAVTAVRKKFLGVF